MPSVSHSEVDSYLLCRRKHYYGYGLSLQRIDESWSLSFGSAVHSILESFYTVILSGGTTNREQLAKWDDAFMAAVDRYGELMIEGYVGDWDKRATLFDVLFNDEYGYFMQEPYTKHGWTILAVEKKFKLQYDDETEGQYPFVIDLIAWNPNREVVVIDHKTTYDLYQQRDSELQPQVPKYIGALRALGHKVDYGQYNMIRSRKIKAPTAEQMHGLMDVRPNADRVVTTFREQIEVAMEIQGRKALPLEVQEKTAYRVANKMICNSCSFADLCATELVGGSAELMKKTEYKVRERVQFDVTEDSAVSA